MSAAKGERAAAAAGSALLFLREEQIRLAQDLMFFAYRDFTGSADLLLDTIGLGRAHHRALHFIGRQPGMTVGELIAILRITKQSLARVLGELIGSGYVAQAPGRQDRRQRLLSLTPQGQALERRLFDAQHRAAGRRVPGGGRPGGGGVQPGDAGRDGPADPRLPGTRRGTAARPGASGRGNAGLSGDAHVLVVDDDDRLRRLLQRYLGENGFRVTTADNAADARAKMRSLQPDLLVLDVTMPGETGLDLTEALRRERSDLPILLLTARGAPEDRIAGFEAGADDYLPKPFDPYELVLRIRAMLRRVAPMEAAAAVPLGTLSFDTVRAELSGADGVIHLTGGEAALLALLARAPGDVLSREAIAQSLGMDEAGERAIDVQVTRLRRKIEADPREPRFLHTVRGRGYTLKPGV